MLAGAVKIIMASYDSAGNGGGSTGVLSYVSVVGSISTGNGVGEVAIESHLLKSQLILLKLLISKLQHL